MIYDIEYAYTSNIGKVRANHEDNFWCGGCYMPLVNNGTDGVQGGTMDSREIPAFAVFDGMGGESCGEIAAGIAAQTFDAYYTEYKSDFRRNPKSFLMDLSSEMNRAVCDYAEANHIRSMGSTAVEGLFCKDWFAVSNLGDSRIYLLADGRLEQLSTDHVLRGGGYRKPPLVQYLGFDESEAELIPSFVRRKVEPGLRLLLCTDGITDMIDDRELAELMGMNENVQKTAGIILEKALENGGRDNATLILVEAKEAEKEERAFGFFGRLFGRRDAF